MAGLRKKLTKVEKRKGGAPNEPSELSTTWHHSMVVLTRRRGLSSSLCMFCPLPTAKRRVHAVATIFESNHPFGFVSPTSSFFFISFSNSMPAQLFRATKSMRIITGPYLAGILSLPSPLLLQNHSFPTVICLLPSHSIFFGVI